MLANKHNKITWPKSTTSWSSVRMNTMLGFFGSESDATTEIQARVMRVIHFERPMTSRWVWQLARVLVVDISNDERLELSTMKPRQGIIHNLFQRKYLYWYWESCSQILIDYKKISKINGQYQTITAWHFSEAIGAL